MFSGFRVARAFTFTAFGDKRFESLGLWGFVGFCGIRVIRVFWILGFGAWWMAQTQPLVELYLGAPTYARATCSNAKRSVCSVSHGALGLSAFTLAAELCLLSK